MIELPTCVNGFPAPCEKGNLTLSIDSNQDPRTGNSAGTTPIPYEPTVKPADPVGIDINYYEQRAHKLRSDALFDGLEAIFNLVKNCLVAGHRNVYSRVNLRKKNQQDRTEG